MIPSQSTKILPNVEVIFVLLLDYGQLILHQKLYLSSHNKTNEMH